MKITIIVEVEKIWFIGNLYEINNEFLLMLQENSEFENSCFKKYKKADKLYMNTLRSGFLILKWMTWHAHIIKRCHGIESILDVKQV